MNRLTVESATGTGAYSKAYTYDTRGNRATMTDGSTSTAYSYDLNNRLLTETKGTTVTNYTYDANGNQLSVGSDTYRYNLLNQLINAKGITYTYQPNGLRASYDDGYTYKQWYNNGNLIYEYCETPDLAPYLQMYSDTSYVYGLELLTRTEGSVHMVRELVQDWENYNGYGDPPWVWKEWEEREEETKNYTTNGQGDVVSFGDNSVATAYTYDAFGNITSQSGGGGSANYMLYRGQYKDPNTGDYYLRARNYTSRTGRFTGEDPHWNPENMIYGDQIKYHTQGELKTAIPDNLAIFQSSNLYNYCMGNPVMYTDYNGEFIISTAVLVGIGVGALIGSIAGSIYGYNVAQRMGIAEKDRWKFVAGYGLGGAIIGGIIGAVIGYGVSAALGVSSGSVLASKSISGAISRVTGKTITHILATKHLWNKVTVDLSWNNVSQIIGDVIKTGATTIIDKTKEGGIVYEAVKKINTEIVVVRYAVIDGVIKISDSWVKTK